MAKASVGNMALALEPPPLGLGARLCVCVCRKNQRYSERYKSVVIYFKNYSAHVKFCHIKLCSFVYVLLFSWKRTIDK